MSNIPENLKYSKSHEWVLEEDGVFTIGLTDYAQNALGDIVFFNLAEEGDSGTSGESFSDAESVKAVSDVFSPVTVTVTAGTGAQKLNTLAVTRQGQNAAALPTPDNRVDTTEGETPAETPGGYVIAILRTFYITVWMILDTTIYADVLTGTPAAVVLTLFNLVIVLAQVVCLWSGLKALRQKAGFEAKCGAAAALIVWNIVLCALGVMNWSGWIVFGIIMIVLYIIIMRRLFALAGELDNAGCTITPVPVRVKDWQLVLSLAVLLAAGMACGYAFGGSYPMEWTPLDNSAQAEVQSTKAKLLELGFPEAVLNDLSAEDIA